MRFLAIGVLTSEVATTETIFNWANALKLNGTHYLIVRNHRNGTISVRWNRASPDSGS